jgi:hypothetical protein
MVKRWEVWLDTDAGSKTNVLSTESEAEVILLPHRDGVID